MSNAVIIDMQYEDCHSHRMIRRFVDALRKSMFREMRELRLAHDRNRTDRASALTSGPRWFQHLIRCWNHRGPLVQAEARSVRFRSCASRNSLIKAVPQGRGVLRVFWPLLLSPQVHFYPHPFYIIRIRSTHCGGALGLDDNAWSTYLGIVVQAEPPGR